MKHASKVAVASKTANNNAPLNLNLEEALDDMSRINDEVKHMEYDIRAKREDLAHAKEHLKRKLIHENRVEFLSLDMAAINRARSN